jgi:hypothetical protein
MDHRRRIQPQGQNQTTFDWVFSWRKRLAKTKEAK